MVHQKLDFNGNILFINNKAENSAGIDNSTIVFDRNSKVYKIHSKFKYNGGSVFLRNNSSIIFDQNSIVMFTKNSAASGIIHSEASNVTFNYNNKVIVNLHATYCSISSHSIANDKVIFRH